MKIVRTFFALSVVIFAASCTYTGTGGNPISRKFTWFSYVNGDDIRKVCADLGADRYRFVYNGIYQRQTRSYDVFFHAKQLNIQVRGDAEINKIKMDDLFAPWRGVTTEVLLDEKMLSEIKQSLIASAALQPAPQGLRLYSDKFYWTVAACVDGKFHFNAYLWPTQRWEKMKFNETLFSLDNTGVEVYPPKNLSSVDIWGSYTDAKPFLLQVGRNGLVGFDGE
ncbi:MAG: hypothetical protein HWE34_19105 [Methylocystaceae bacterium]|nr:hypothetical protein [Methylocystaceae bacterium]